jgi:2-keto-3-deoxy-L-rhamnonate aldolase RhmA
VTGGPRIGTVLSLPAAMLAELAGHALDLAWIDLEHGALCAADVPPLAIALEAAGCEPHVRLACWDSEVLPAVVDAGVAGVVAPGMERPEDVEGLVARLRYAPLGRRGFGPRRAGRYGREPRFWSSPGAGVACTVQVESPAGVEAAAAMAAVDGVDALVVGCGDLALALGAPGDMDAPALRDAVRRVAAAARAAGVGFGLAGGGDPAVLAALAPPHTDVLVHSVDVRLYAAAIDGAARELRAAMAGRRTVPA